jgi:UDP-N-acetylmuramate--alanine ligase
VNGANVVGWEGAVRFGSGQYAVAEVDESDKSLSAFSPYAAIVTNSSADHFSKDEMDEVFDAFIAKATGPVLDARGETYLPEDYMAQNESLAVRMAVMLGCDENAARASLASFKGVERRLQPCGAAVYDDYAHNPEKLRSMIAVLKKRHRGAICVIWRPHGYGPLKKMLDGLAAMFSEALSTDDALLVLPVYDAGGTADRTIGSEALVGRVSGPEAVKADSFDDVAAWCGENARRFAAVAVAGARDPGLPALARRIAADRLGEGAAR